MSLLIYGYPKYICLSQQKFYVIKAFVDTIISRLKAFISILDKIFSVWNGKYNSLYNINYRTLNRILAFYNLNKV